MVNFVSIPIIKTHQELRDFRRNLLPSETLALVPTMGSLHQGHLSLVREARKYSSKVLVSIFVNPAQFGPDEDFDRYPRDLKRDQNLLASEQVDGIFIPDTKTLYPGDFQTWVYNSKMAKGLCSNTRPHFFQGVCTVVLKLFNQVQPDVAVFGRKDLQQLRIIEQMVRDLQMNVRIVGAPIVREPDGLAMSSRNAYLKQEQRQKALGFPQSLLHARDLFRKGCRDPDELTQAAKNYCEKGGDLRVDYIELRDEKTLEPVREAGQQGTVLIAAAQLGSVRLIDNLSLNYAEDL